jgi:hypothetical protein
MKFKAMLSKPKSFTRWEVSDKLLAAVDEV